MSVTIKDIAKEAGVSIGAVSKALNDRGGTSLVLKRKIEKIARRMGYFPYIKSRQTGMFAGASKSIGIIFSFAGEYLSKEIQKGIDNVLSDSGFYQIRYAINVSGQYTDEVRKESFIDKVIQDRSLAGLLAVFMGVSDRTVARLHKSGIPVVQLNNFSSYGKCVTTDNEESAYRATRALIKQGRRKIGLVMPGEIHEAVWELRLAGYKKALIEARLPYDPYLIEDEHSFDLKESALATKTLLEREPKIDAILFGSDTQAYGGMEALKSLNRRIPDDVAVIGFDDLPFSAITDPPLSSVNQPMFEMGKKASEMLLEAIRNKDFSYKSVVLKSKLVLRQSSNKNLPKERII
ncbi:MAG: LacI family DNA-binding transcriptional regulator [Elusimicrobiota bacterium]